MIKKQERISVFGANGFIGMHLCNALIAAGTPLTVFDRVTSLPIPHSDNRFGDFQNKDDVIRALEGSQTAIHLIHTTLPVSSNLSPYKDAEENILASIQFLEAAKEAGIKRVIYVSSGGTIYGAQFNLPIPEETILAPTCAYAVSKAAIEYYLGLYKRLHGIDYTILRLANPYGPFQSTHKGNGVIATFIEGYLKGAPLSVWGNGLTVRDYIYIDDVISAIVASLTYEGSGHTFNIGSGTGVSVNQIISILESIVGQSLERHYVTSRKADVPQNILDIRKAKKELSWEPKIHIYEGIRTLFQIMKGL